MIIAGVGSRETPSAILTEMTLIGAWCRSQKIWVRSGHAPGADQAFELGAQEYCIAYIPWEGFERGFKTRARMRVPEAWGTLQSHAAGFHPAWSRLSDPVRRLMGRNSAQVLGERLDTPVQALVAWTKDGGPTGGTGQALRIAAALKIPVLNMYHERFNTAQKVTDYLCSMET